MAISEQGQRARGHAWSGVHGLNCNRALQMSGVFSATWEDAGARDHCCHLGCAYWVGLGCHWGYGGIWVQAARGHGVGHVCICGPGAAAVCDDVHGLC